MISKDEIIKAIEELKDSYLEFVELENKEVDLKVKIAKAQKRLSMARDNLRNIKL